MNSAAIKFFALVDQPIRDQPEYPFQLHRMMQDMIEGTCGSDLEHSACIHTTPDILMMDKVDIFDLPYAQEKRP